jgi:hypothetical protein
VDGSRAAPSASAASEPPPSERGSHLEELITPRAALGPAARKPWHLADRGGFWLLLAVGPMTVLAITGGGRALQRVRGRWSARKLERASGPQAAVREAARAVEAGEHGAAASAIERAIYVAIERRTGLKARGILREDLAADLASRGITGEHADEIVRLLGDCDALRFGSLAPEALRSLVPTATKIVEGLARRRDHDAARGRG